MNLVARAIFILSFILSSIFIAVDFVFPPFAFSDLPSPNEALILSEPVDRLVLDRSFVEVMKAIETGELAQASESLDSMLQQALDQGYVNLSDFSARLLELAASKVVKGDKSEFIGFIVRQAVAISPFDAQVYLTAAGFYDFIGVELAGSYLLRGLVLLVGSPRLIVGVVLSSIFILLIGLTGSHLFVCIMQVVTHVETLIQRFGEIVSVRYRGLFTPLLFFTLISLPLLGGILACLAVWSLVLNRYVRQCRFMGVVGGLLILIWGMIIPVVQTIGYHLLSEPLRLIELVHHQSYSNLALSTLSDELQQRPNQPMLMFTLGSELLHHDGKLAEGVRLLERGLVLAQATGQEALAAAFQNNLAVASYLQGDYERASSFLSEVEKRDYTSVATLYNMAQVQIALLDIEKQRAYYQRAHDRDADLITWREQIEKIGTSPYRKMMFVGAPASSFYPWFVKPVVEPSARNQWKLQEDRLYRSLMGAGSSLTFIALGVVVCLFALSMQGRKTFRGGKDPQRQELSKVWVFIPGASFIIRGYPVWGVCILGILATSIIAVTGRPVSYVNLALVAWPGNYFSWIIFGLFAIGLVFGTSSMGIYQTRK